MVIAYCVVDTIEYENKTFEYYVTCDAQGQLTFHVEASEATPQMRLKINDLIVHADDEDLGLEVAISQESDQQVIEHYVRDVLVHSIS